MGKVVFKQENNEKKLRRACQRHVNLFLACARVVVRTQPLAVCRLSFLTISIAPTIIN